MSKHLRSVPFSALALGIAAALAFSPTAFASGFQLKENSVKAMGRAFAGSGTAQGDASVVVNNPAAMSAFQQNTVQADINVVDIKSDFTGGGFAAAGSPLQSPLTGGNGGNAGGTTPVPAMAAIFPLGDSKLTVGAAVSAPFGLKTEYDRDWVGRYNAVKSDVKVVDLTLSVSLAVTDRFSVGGSLIAERAEATLSNAIDFGTGLASLAVPGFLPQSADGFASVHGTNNGYGWQFGALWRPTDALQIGYTHRSEIDHDLKGNVDFTVPATAAAVFQSFGITTYNDTAAVAPLTLPSVDSISLSYALTPTFTLMADVTKTGWSSLQNVTIYRADGTLVSNEPFNWKDTYFYSLGAEYALSDTLTLRAGVAYDQTPTNNVTRTPRLPDQNRHWVSLGVSWMATPALEVNGGYTRIQVSKPTINGIVSSSGSILTGSYDSSINLFGVSARYGF